MPGKFLKAAKVIEKRYLQYFLIKKYHDLMKNVVQQDYLISSNSI